MRYLLDTHIILWSLINDKHLSNEVIDIIKNKNNEIYYSTASTWEVEIKHQKIKEFKLSGEQFAFLCDQNGLFNIQISNKHIFALNDLIKESNVTHNDPFDKILLSQSISENMIFVTRDKKFNLV